MICVGYGREQAKVMDMEIYDITNTILLRIGFRICCLWVIYHKEKKYVTNVITENA